MGKSVAKKAIEKQLEKNGVKMAKMISAGSSGGLFTAYTPPVYDRRTVYTLESLYKLSDEGFSIDGTNVGIFLLNAFLDD